MPAHTAARSPRSPPGRRAAGTHHRLRKGLIAGGVAVAAAVRRPSRSRRGESKPSRRHNRAPAVARCEPTRFNRSATLRGDEHQRGAAARLLHRVAADADQPARRARERDLHVIAKGSRSGVHDGQAARYSQGDGASFVPSDPFLSGETVTVRGKLRSAARTRSFGYSFVVATPDALPYSKPKRAVGAGLQREDALPLGAGAASAERRRHGALGGERAGRHLRGAIFGTGSGGADDLRRSGQPRLVQTACRPASRRTNLQVQSLDGRPVLTWWAGLHPKQGFGQGEQLIYDTSYRQVGARPRGQRIQSRSPRVPHHGARHGAGDGVRPDRLQPLQRRAARPAAPSPTASFRKSTCAPGWSDASGTASTRAARRLLQLADGASHEWPYDYFHLNSIDQHPDGTTLISARNTWAIYQLNTTTGQLQNAIGGHHSGVKLGQARTRPTSTTRRRWPNGEISVFDNGSVPKVHSQSRGLVARAQREHRHGIARPRSTSTARR